MKQIFSLLFMGAFIVLFVLVARGIYMGYQEMADMGGLSLSGFGFSPDMPVVYVGDMGDQEEQALVERAVDQGDGDAAAIQRALDQAGLNCQVVVDAQGDIYVERR